MGSLKQYILIAIFLILVLVPAAAQQKIIGGVIQDSHSEEPVPFASISFKNTTVGKLADSSGAFLFYLNNWPSDTLLITSVGYRPFIYIINRAKDSIHTTVIMERGTFNEGANVKVKVNKGLLVWRKI